MSNQSKQSNVKNLHGGMPDASWNYATLPFRSGGMGITPAALLPDICYVASILSTFPKNPRNAQGRVLSLPAVV